MRLTRCFVPCALEAGVSLVLPEAASGHIARVLRLRSGDALTLFDGRGGEFEATIDAIERRGVRVRLGIHHAIEREAPVAVRLLQCLVRAERMDFIVQKATELGVASIVPVQSRHSVVRLDGSGSERRRQHWHGVAISACEQCGRNRVPEVQEPQTLERACAEDAADAGASVPGSTSPGHARLLLDPAGSQPLAGALAALRDATALTLLVGPEGGLRDDEIAFAQQHGFRSCTLGPRVLRAETAPLAALAAVQALLGDFAARDAR
jgi:16S rRNA (uracil1498-N3)-methyltransferase